ncbi:serine/threonine protein kinase [Pelomyxa schiedti]|nr:serine/threonine protein kinase [Pelomyxa schiedti]
MSGVLSGSYMFTEACTSGQLNRVEEVLAPSSHVAVPPSEMARGFLSACREGHAHVVEWLLRLPAWNPDFPGAAGPFRPSLLPRKGAAETPLGVACQRGHVKVARLLMAAAEPAGVDMLGTGMPLFHACQGGHLEIVGLLLERPVSSVTPEEIGRSLVAACKGGFYGIAAALLGLNPPHMRPSPKFETNTGETPLGVSCCAGHLEVVGLLLDTMGSSTVYTEDIAEGLVIACKGGHAAVVNKFLNLPLYMKPSLNHISKFDRTALSAACEAGHKSVVDLLIREEQQDVNLGNALWYASKNNHLETVESLLRHPSIVENKMFDNKTPLVVAILHNQTDKDFLVARALISHSGLIPPHCQESVVSKVGGYPKLWQLYHFATSVELPRLLLDRQQSRVPEKPRVESPPQTDIQPAKNAGKENEEVLALRKRITELEAEITTINGERLLDLKARELDQQTCFEIQNFTDHVLMHVEGGSWCHFPPEGNCKKGQISISLEECPPFVETVCCSCPLDMLVKNIISRKFDVEPKEQIISADGADNSAEERLTNTTRTLTDLQKNDTVEGRVVQIKVRIALAMSIQEEDLKVVSTLGTGSYGTVSKCIHTKTNRQVAVKSLHDLIRSDFMDNKFQQEAVISSRLRHPNIVSCLGTCASSTGGLQIISELMELSLRQLLARRSLSFQEIIALSVRIARGMSALHKRSVMHRDLSSNNVLLDYQGNPKITDFGVAHVVKATTVGTLTKGAGTPPYLAPQMYGIHYGMQGDMWEFAVLLGEMLKGSIPDSDLPRGLAKVIQFISEQCAFLSGLDVAEVNRLCQDPEVGEMAVAECLGRRKAILDKLWSEPKFANIPGACVRLFSLVVDNCLSVLENNRPPFSAIEKQLMTCAQLVFCPWADDDRVDECVTKCLADLAASSFPSRLTSSS